MTQLDLLLDRVFFHNPVRQWAIAVGIALVAFVVLLVARRVLVSRVGAAAKRTSTIVDDTLVALVGRTRAYFLAAVAVVFASHSLTLPRTTDDYLATAFALVILAQVGVWGTTIVNGWSDRQIVRRSAHADAASASTLRAVAVGAKLLLWSIVLITALARFGVNVTALVTGLGITGVAIALAVQSILSDVLAALSIVVDKPFDVGDFIVVDQAQGTVEHIGLKTTRLRSVGGEQIIISNSELLKNRIGNFKRMFERRVVFLTDVAYDTPADVVARIPTMIKEIIGTQHPVRFDRSHFSAFTDSALRVETVYFVLDPDFNRYCDIQQAINLELLRRFEAEGISFAHPMRAVHVFEHAPSAEEQPGVVRVERAASRLR